MTDDTTRLLDRLAETFPDRSAPLAELVAAAHTGRRRRTRRNVAVAAGACVLAVAAGLGVQQVLPDDVARTDRIADSREVCDKGNPVPPKEPVPAGPDYPTNAARETYGSATEGSPQPDLLAAVGDCGRTGYIDPLELDPPPWVPGAGTPRSTPVYESDGVTQIDTFTEQAGTAGADGVTDPPAPAGPDAGDVRGEWNAMIAGVSSGGKDQYDTYRDLDLTIAFTIDEVRVFDGCRTWVAGFTLADAAFALTTPWTAGSSVTCKRAAPLPQVLDNVQRASEDGRRTYLNLANGQIVVVLTRA